MVQVIEESYQSLFGKKTPAPTGLHASIWTDTNIYNEMGIPACKFGLGGGRWKFRSEQIDVEDIFPRRPRLCVGGLGDLQLGKATGLNLTGRRHRLLSDIAAL